MISKSLRELARDFGHAAAAMPDAAEQVVTEAATGVETRAHALDVTTGVVVTRPTPTTAVVSSTQTFGVYAEGGGKPVVPVNAGQVADGLTSALLDGGVQLIVKGRA